MIHFLSFFCRKAASAAGGPPICPKRIAKSRKLCYNGSVGRNVGASAGYFVFASLYLECANLSSSGAKIEKKAVFASKVAQTFAHSSKPLHTNSKISPIRKLTDVSVAP